MIFITGYPTVNTQL